MIGRCLIVGTRHAVPTLDVSTALERAGFEVHVEEWPGPVRRGLFDWAIDLAGRRLNAEVFQYGVWWLETEHGGRWPAGSAGTAEIADAVPLTGLRLNARGGLFGQHPKVVRDAWIRTDPYSPVRQRYRVDRLACELIERAALDLQSGTVTPLEDAEPAPRPHRLSYAQTRRLPFQKWRGWAAAQVDDTFLSDHWTVGVVNAPVHRFLDPDFRPTVDWLEQPSREVFEADPHIVLRDDGAWDVYAEAFDYRVGVGTIVARRFENGTWGPSRPVLSAEHHLSYPHVFEAGARRFATYECAESGRINLCSVDRAGGWTPGEPMLDFPGLDPTVFAHEGRWWLFATDGTRTKVDVLHAWYSESPTGPWTPHARNPIKVDVRSSRPAGALFRHEGNLYRPAQDGTSGYGSAIGICRVDELTPDTFSETRVATVPPFAQRPDGIHTLNGVGEMSVVDGKRRIVVPSTIDMRVQQKLEVLRGLFGGIH